MIIATHKRANLLRRALDSVLAQTFKDIEVWCVHDGPWDLDTEEVYKEYVEKFEEAGIDFYPTGLDLHTGYYCTPRNEATMNSRGVYIANLDDDNEWLPDTLESLLGAMDEGETWPDIVYGRRRYVLDPGAPEEWKGINLKSMEGDSPFVPYDDMAMVRLLGNQPMLNFIDSSDFLVAKGALYRMAIKSGHIWEDGCRRFGDFKLMSDGVAYGDWRFKALDKVVQIYHVTGDNISLNRPVDEVPREVNV